MKTRKNKNNKTAEKTLPRPVHKINKILSGIIRTLLNKEEP